VRRRGLLAAAAAAGFLLAACGGPAKLDSDQKKTLTAARERLDEAIDTEEAIRTAPAEARRRVRAVHRRLGGPALSVLEDAAPALVDEAGVRDFVRYARRDPARALHGPAERQVLVMTSTLRGKSPDTKIGGQTAAAYLGEAARDTRPIWPDLAHSLVRTREALD
jgi:outer membrane murein-binding lipoprotein Lpp